MMGSFPAAREWLVRGLRALERLDPVPLRAVSFVQAQLSQALAKQGHEDEALRVLDKAARYHLTHCQEKLTKWQALHGGSLTTPAPAKGSALYDEVVQALDLTARVSLLCRKVGNLWAAAEQAEVRC